MSVPAASINLLPQNAKAAMELVVKLSRLPRRMGNAGKNNELQDAIDGKLFCMQPDRRTKLTSLQQYALMGFLAQFFLERADDTHKFSYFEALFLGREGDAALHAWRLDFLMRFASFSLQFPVLNLYNLITAWFDKIKTVQESREVADSLIGMLVEHYIVAEEEHKMYEYLLSLSETCPEITTYFLALAPQKVEMSDSMCIVINYYFLHSSSYILKNFRDTPWLGEDFATKVFPKWVKYYLSQANPEEPLYCNVMVTMSDVLSQWNEVVTSSDKTNTTKSDLNYDCLLEEDRIWCEGRCLILTLAAEDPVRLEPIKKKLQQIKVPPTYRNFLTTLLD